MKNVIKLFAMMLAVALCACCAALAEEPIEIGGLEVNSLIEDGEFIIQVDVSNSDLNWEADDMAQDDSVVRLAASDVIEDTFVARYTPTGDGDVSVGVRHFTGIACDQVITWDLHVENGAVQEVIGGSNAQSLGDADYDPFLLGEWREQDTQFAEMTIENNPERGWDVEIVSPVSHGAYVFRASVIFDCELNGFVYDDGRYWDIDGAYEVGAELGDARTEGTMGILCFEGEEEAPTLSWYDTERPEETLAFARVETDAADD